MILPLHGDRFVFAHVQDWIAAALRHFQESAIGVAHHAQLLRVQLVQRAIVVGPIQLIAVAIEVHRVFLDGVLAGRRRTAVAACAAGGGSQSKNKQSREEEAHIRG